MRRERPFVRREARERVSGPRCGAAQAAAVDQRRARRVPACDVQSTGVRGIAYVERGRQEVPGASRLMILVALRLGRGIVAELIDRDSGLDAVREERQREPGE